MSSKEAENQHDTPRRLYRIDEDSGRGFGVEALFTAHVEDIERLYGWTIWFGEISGKHSDISLELSAENCKEVSADPVVVVAIESAGRNIRDKWTPFDSFTISGHNPFGFIEDETDEILETGS